MTLAGLVTGHDVKEAVRGCLAAHLPPVLAALSAGLDAPLAAPTAYYAPTIEAVRKDAAELPALAVLSPGMAGPMRRDENGIFTADWNIVIGLWIRSEEGTYDATARDTVLYSAAVRTVLAERPLLDGFAQDVFDVEEGDYGTVAADAARTLGEASISCTVRVFDAARQEHRYTDPDYQAPPEASATTVTIGPDL